MNVINVNEENFSVNNLNQTIYQFLYSINKVQPCFCYHEKLTIAGNCRMCLVEANGALVASCAMPLINNMKINTFTNRVIHARESVLEFLLINHPLDCPVCDQGGECDLQDIGRTYGIDRGRFYENKRSVDNLTCFGPMVKTIMTRCIHCTRCVRFLNEYCDEYKLGVLGRGSSMEIGTYVNTFIYHELCANIIDICPVGALTSMPYAFTARPWELTSIETIDVLDSMASTIRVEIMNNKVLRTLPILTEDLNEDWITNKTRFTFDAYNTQRLYYPNFNNLNISWLKSLKLLVSLLYNLKIANLKINIGSFTDFETGYSLKTFFNSIGCSNITYQNNFIKNQTDYRFYYLFKNNINDFENFDLVILLGLNLRLDNPLLNSRFRKNFLRNHFVKFYSLGCSMIYSNFPLLNLGNSNISIMNFLFCKLTKIKNFLSFLSMQNFNLKNSNTDNTVILLKNSFDLLMPFLKKSYSNINIFSEHLGKIICKELGFNVTNNNNELKNFIYNIGTDYDRINSNDTDFVVYQGSFRPKKANLALPTVFYTEKNSTYLNLEGKIRIANLAITAIKSCFTDTEIFRLLNIILIKSIKSRFSIFDNFDEFTSNFKGILIYNYIFFDNIEQLFELFSKNTGFNLKEIGRISHFILNELIYKKLFLSNVFINRSSSNYYNNDYLSRLSKTMAICAQKIIHNNFSDDIYYNNN